MKLLLTLCMFLTVSCVEFKTEPVQKDYKDFLKNQDKAHQTNSDHGN